MAIIVIWGISVLFILSFSVTERRIHLFEGITVWCFLILAQNIFFGMGFTYKLLKLPSKLSDHLAYDSVRGIIIPLSIILFLELNGSVKAIWEKAYYWAGIIFFLVGLEYFADLLNAIGHSGKWKWWWSFAYYTVLVSLTYMVFKLVRNIASREVFV